METYAKILLYAMPAFLTLILLEMWYGRWKGHHTVRSMDMLSSISSGITNVTKDVLGLSLVLISYGWLISNLAVFHVDSGFWTYFIAFMALDFAGYWVHRIAHKTNFFWNSHIIHHSSEYFNLACALRQSIANFVKVFTVFLLPAALMGVPVQVIAVVAPLHLFAQFWYHTQHINRMGWLEYILVTPSHHRVHHAINPQYIDKNFAQIFIFWDKLFGTFQEELIDEKPVYGITVPVRTWNPIKINFQHMGLLIKDCWRTRSWKDKLRIWLMPTGWRPDDVKDKYPILKIEDLHQYQKYDTPVGTLLSTWIWVQFSILLLLIAYLFGNIASIGSPHIFLYGIFIFMQVYAYSELMDRNPRAWIYELLKNVWCLYLLWLSPDWFGAGAMVQWIPAFLAFYFIVSGGITFLFSRDQIAASPVLKAMGQ
ncbi:MAG: sterol desaturase family protein [Sphingobacteriaceae bacterium]